jgi:hypothetical protein
MSAAEIDGMMGKVLGEGQDAIAQALSRVVVQVRGFCRTAGVEMGAAGTIPEELIPAAMDVAAPDVLMRLNMEVKQDRRSRRENAIDLFKSVATRDFTILGPNDAETDTGVATPQMKARTRTLGREYENGI